MTARTSSSRTGQRVRRTLALGIVAASAATAACSDDRNEGEGHDRPGLDAEPLFPEDYRDSYVEVRDCRGSGDHDLNQVRMLVDPTAERAYQQRDTPFPVAAVVLKEEYEFSDIDCEGPVLQWTVMRRLAEGSGEDTSGWAWQRVNSERRVMSEDDARCTSCHSSCGRPPDGYQGTCSIP